jgi:hypothetical protein
MTEKNSAQFKAFYPIQDSIDRRARIATCIKLPDSEAYPLLLNYQQRVRQIVKPDDLIIFPISGKNENVVSKEDRHLNKLGNTKTVESLALYLTN